MAKALLARSKYGAVMREEAGRVFLADTSEIRNSGVSLNWSMFYQLVPDDSADALEAALYQLKTLVTGSELLQRCEGALGVLHIAYRLYDRADLSELTECSELLRTCASQAIPMLFSENIHEQYASCWMFAWIGSCRVWTPPTYPNILDRLFSLWLHSPNSDVCNRAGWAFGSLPLLPREAGSLDASPAISDFITKAKEYNEVDRVDQSALLVAGYYLP